LSEADSFNSLRIGLASQYQITNQLILTPEVAYIPLVSFNGLDSHNARQLLGPESSSQGDGTNTQYTLNANTSAVILGDASQSLSTWGWSIGAGLEYAFNDRWSSSVEYDYIGMPKQTIAFPTIQLINEQNMTVNQSVNLGSVHDKKICHARAGGQPFLI